MSSMLVAAKDAIAAIIALASQFIAEGRRKKEEGRRKKEEGRRKKEEGRRKMQTKQGFHKLRTFIKPWWLL
ncbi:MAG TPA: hypothetical protein VK211_04945 [Kamptonema sp.]|nr:hypothetical protein [Kamptonema sp.]